MEQQQLVSALYSISPCDNDIQQCKTHMVYIPGICISGASYIADIQYCTPPTTTTVFFVTTILLKTKDATHHCFLGYYGYPKLR